MNLKKYIKYGIISIFFFLLMLVGFEFYSQQVRINGPWPVEALNVIKTNCLADYKKIYPVKNDINISLLDKIFIDSCSCRSDAIEKAKIVNVIPSAFQDDQDFKTEFAKEIMSYFASNAGQESQSKCLKKSEKINNVTTILLKPVLAELLLPRCFGQASSDLKNNKESLSKYCHCMSKLLSEDFVYINTKEMTGDSLGLAATYLENMITQFHTDNAFHSNCFKQEK